MTNETEASGRPAPDIWDQLDSNTYWVPLAATTADEFFSGEVDNLFIRRDMGRWWLSHTGEMGQRDFLELAAAKDVGATILQDSYASMERLVTEDLGVPTDAWDVAFENGSIIVRSKIDPEVEIFGNDGEWSFEGKNFYSTSTDFGEVFAVAEALVQAPAAPSPPII